jgi:hypothetical protein
MENQVVSGDDGLDFGVALPAGLGNFCKVERSSAQLCITES